jgi:cytochrome c oxidase assembly protein subunit 15
MLAALGLATWLAAPARWADGIVLGITGMAALGAGLVWPRCEPSPRWLRRLGLAAFFAVVLQGVLGGLRVVLYKDQIGVFHAALAQLFFVLVCAIGLFTSGWWQEQGVSVKGRGRGAQVPPTLQWLLFATTSLILGQLLLGAVMRHQHAGLAIPDFPLAYGKLWPAMDPSSVERYNQHRMEATGVNPITAVQVGLQMAHRLVALLILGAVAWCAWSARRKLGRENSVSKLALVWLALILAQALLGAATIWSNKAADIATAHVMTGALSLALGAILCIVSCREGLSARWPAQPDAPRPDSSPIPYGARPASATGLD